MTSLQDGLPIATTLRRSELNGDRQVDKLINH